LWKKRKRKKKRKQRGLEIWARMIESALSAICESFKPSKHKAAPFKTDNNTLSEWISLNNVRAISFSRCSQALTFSICCTYEKKKRQCTMNKSVFSLWNKKKSPTATHFELLF
jgi:hypothetical protein